MMTFGWKGRKLHLLLLCKYFNASSSSFFCSLRSQDGSKGLLVYDGTWSSSTHFSTKISPCYIFIYWPTTTHPKWVDDPLLGPKQHFGLDRVVDPRCTSIMGEKKKKSLYGSVIRCPVIGWQHVQGVSPTCCPKRAPTHLLTSWE